MSYNHRKLFSFITIALLLVITLGLSCCIGGYRLLHPPGTRAPEQFPDTEIVFGAGNGKIGFVNGDGSGLTYITIWENSENGDYSYATFPMLLNDGATLIYLLTKVNPVNEPYIGDTGKVVVAVNGEFPLVCETWYAQKPQILDNMIITLNKTTSVLEFHSPVDCKNENSLPMNTYEAPIFEPMDQDEGIPVYAYISPNLQYMAYSIGELRIRNLSSGEEVSPGRGDYPAWSPDSQWLSYVGDDGIYIVHADGSGKKMVFESTFSNSMIYQSSVYYVPPWPSWSPDGHWLIYHLYKSDWSSNIPDEIPIYKLNIDTGEIIKILDYGIFPSWRWSTEP